MQSSFASHTQHKRQWFLFKKQNVLFHIAHQQSKRIDYLQTDITCASVIQINEAPLYSVSLVLIYFDTAVRHPAWCNFILIRQLSRYLWCVHAFYASSPLNMNCKFIFMYILFPGCLISLVELSPFSAPCKTKRD